MGTVVVLATGGTISSRSTAVGRTSAVSGTGLIAQAGLADDPRLRVADMDSAPSFALRHRDLPALARRVSQELTDEVAGIVVTHGTDTMEEQAFLTDLLHDGPAPVVFTGAQRPFDHPGADGPANLTDAVAVADSPLACRRGVLLCFDGYVYAARGVTKVDTQGTHTFDAPGRGPLLRVVDGQVTALTPRNRSRCLPFRPDVELPRVDVVPLYVGCDTTALHAAIRAGAHGIVLEAFGAGNANPAMVDAVGVTVADDMPVVVCSRVPAGPVAPLYTGGGGADLAAAGAIFGNDLSAWQARLLLSVALTQPDPAAALRDWLRGDDTGEESWLKKYSSLLESTLTPLVGGSVPMAGRTRRPTSRAECSPGKSAHHALWSCFGATT